MFRTGYLCIFKNTSKLANPLVSCMGILYSYHDVIQQLPVILVEVTALFSSLCSLLHQGGHGTGKTGNLAVNFSRQGKYREFSKLIFYTGKIVATQGKFCY